MYELLVRLLEPYTFLVLGLALVTIWAWRRQRPPGRPLKVASVLVALLVVLSMPIVSHFALGTLEWSYSPTTQTPGPSDTIVVLGGDIIVDDDEGTQVRLGDVSFQRCHYAAKLYHEAGGCRVILCGGKVDWSEPGPTIGATMRDFLVELGAQRNDLVAEEKSSTTYENALRTKELLERAPATARVFLVTEATHMRRAERCFRALGVEVVPAPCDFHASRHEIAIRSFIPAWGGIGGVCRAAHEWLGLAWYRLKGRI
ncbi:MAG: YdcF family protein [Planctomycetaceae bacterium]